MTKHNLNVTSWNYKNMPNAIFYHQVFSDEATYEHQKSNPYLLWPIMLGVRS
jgi:hypothetical protein